MAHDSGNEKQQARELIERLAPGQVSAVVRLVEVMADPLARSLANAPVVEDLLIRVQWFARPVS